MRKKTDQRRQGIVDAAKCIIRQDGLERASICAIAKRIGGSKSTIYSYFSSKEELLGTAMTEAVMERGGDIADGLIASDPDVEKVLKRFGRSFVKLIMNSDALAVVRAAVVEGGQGRMGPVLYAMGPCRGVEAIGAYLRCLPSERGLYFPDPRRAALHLKSLLEAGVIEPLLYGMPVEGDIEHGVDAAVEVFLRGYGIGLQP